MIVVSMFDESGNMLRPWANRGDICYAFDIINTERVEWCLNGGCIIFKCADLLDISMLLYIVSLKPDIIFGFPPCTDLAVSGAKHFASKAAIDPLFQIKAVALARSVEIVGALTGKPWFAENPRSVLSTLWRKPDFSFEPWEYGAVLPLNDVHPRWPEYIASRDAYPKTTYGWTGNGFIVPPKMPVVVPNGYSTQFKKLGGKSAKTKKIRSETPRGFAECVCIFNRHV